MTGYENDPHIETLSGEFRLSDMQFNIVDIAWGLSQLCRYNGQCKQFYSVAEHSVLVAWLMDKYTAGNPLEGLMHDACEAYIGDLPSPWKPLVPDFVALEDRIDRAVRAKWQLPYPKTEDCKWADTAAAFIEAKYLVRTGAKYWPDPLGVRSRAEQISADYLGYVGERSQLEIHERFLVAYRRYARLPEDQEI
jgi:hypothetical protein